MLYSRKKCLEGESNALQDTVSFRSSERVAIAGLKKRVLPEPVISTGLVTVLAKVQTLRTSDAVGVRGHLAPTTGSPAVPQD